MDNFIDYWNQLSPIMRHNIKTCCYRENIKNPKEWYNKFANEWEATCNKINKRRKTK